MEITESDIKDLRLLSRFIGLVDAGAFGFIGYYITNGFYNILQDINANPAIDIFFPEFREIIRVSLLASSIVTLYGVADGIGDIIKGGHHYLGLKTAEKLGFKWDKNPLEKILYK